MINLETSVNEEGSILVNIIITDSTGYVFPLESMESVRWQLSDKYGAIINNRTFDNGLITENPIVLTGDDLIIDDSGICRIVAVKIVYNSDIQENLNATEEGEFKINDLINIGT